MTSPHPKTDPRRVPIAALADADAVLAGRLSVDGTARRLRDDSGAIDLLGDALPTDLDGALVEVEGQRHGAAFAVSGWRVLVGTRPGPAPHVPRPEVLRARARMNAALRQLFDADGFVEVETPCLVPTPGTDVYLEAFQTRFTGLGEFPPADLYLHTSPEFAMKRLLVSGMERIYQICKCFRQGEATARHDPEFSMIEWYRAFADYTPIMHDVERVVRSVCGDGTLAFGDARIDLGAPFERLTVREAFARHCDGLDILATSDAPSLRAAAEARGLCTLTPGGGWDDLFFELLLLYVEPNLGLTRPTFLTDYPTPMAVLARRRDDDPRVAERFELYIAGVELCNGFTELNDPVEQRARFAEDLGRRVALGLPPYPVPTAFLDALDRGMPPSGGVALGLDRLLMLSLDLHDIDHVLMRAVPACDQR